MEQLIETLKQIDKGFYRGAYTVGEFYDVKKALNQILTDKYFI